MFEPGPTEEELAPLGLTLDDVAEQVTVEVLPDVWPALQVFLAMRTQWRVGSCGATGLDYAALPAVLRLLRVKPADQPALFDDLRAMEEGALAYFGEKHG